MTHRQIPTSILIRNPTQPSEINGGTVASFLLYYKNKEKSHMKYLCVRENGKEEREYGTVQKGELSLVYVPPLSCWKRKIELHLSFSSFSYLLQNAFKGIYATLVTEMGKFG